MDMDRSESRLKAHERDDRDVTPLREYKGRGDEDLEENGADRSSKNRSKVRKKGGRGEEKDHRSKDRDQSKKIKDDAKDSEKDRVSSRDRRKEDIDDHEKDRSREGKVKEKDGEREKYREKEHEREKERKDRGKEKEREREREREAEKDSDRGQDKEKGKEKNRDRDRDRAREKEREKEKDKHKDREKENNKDTDREKGKERTRGQEKEGDQSKEKSRERDRTSSKINEENNDLIKDGRRDYKRRREYEDNRDADVTNQERMPHHTKGEENSKGPLSGAQPSASELAERIQNMKDDRLKRKTENVPDILAWVGRSRKIEEKRNAEKVKALQLSKIFEEQDNIDQGESDEEETAKHTNYDLAGVKVLHGLDKVMEGGAVVLTLKDQNILVGGDINEDVDMLENIEIGEQKLRDGAYKAAKRKTGTYSDKFNDEPGGEKKMLPQYDDPAVDEGITLDERGRVNIEAEKKLEELRRRLKGASTDTSFQDLNSSGKTAQDFYSQEEMLQFKKPKKKKSLRKKEMLDINALEAEAVSAGLGVGDLGSRNDSRRQALKEEKERSEAEKRNDAYQAAYNKADEASKSLRLEPTLSTKLEENEDSIIVDDDEDLFKSLGRARKLALKKQGESVSGPQAVALLAAAAAATSNQSAEDKNTTTGESQENKVVFTEMEEFVWGLQLDEESHKPNEEDVFMNEDDEPNNSMEIGEPEVGGWTEVKETVEEEEPIVGDGEDIVPDETIHEVAVGKGLSGALKLLKDRGTLKETVEWGGRNMDKKKSKLVGIMDNEDGPKDSKEPKSKNTRASSLIDNKKEIHIERTDEFGRILTPKEAFRQISHKFHGKGPGKMKQEKRMRQYQEELKLKQMKNSDTPSMSVERMREAQAQLKTPYLVLSGHVKPGQTSDPRSGFATVEKEFPGGLTPMLGDRKVEHFLGIKRNGEHSTSGTPKETSNSGTVFKKPKA